VNFNPPEYRWSECEWVGRLASGELVGLFSDREGVGITRYATSTDDWLAAFRLIKPKEQMTCRDSKTAYGANSSPPNNGIGSGTRSTKPCWRQTVPQLTNVVLKKDLPPVPPAAQIDERPAGRGGRRTGPDLKSDRAEPRHRNIATGKDAKAISR
jgi:hypothetical protein